MKSSRLVLSVAAFCLIFANSSRADWWGDQAERVRNVEPNTRRGLESTWQGFWDANTAVDRAYDTVERGAAPYIHKYLPQYSTRVSAASYIRRLKLRSNEYLRNRYNFLVIVNDANVGLDVRIRYLNANSNRWEAAHFEFAPGEVNSVDMKTHNRYVYISANGAREEQVDFGTMFSAKVHRITTAPQRNATTVQRRRQNDPHIYVTIQNLARGPVTINLRSAGRRQAVTVGPGRAERFTGFAGRLSIEFDGNAAPGHQPKHYSMTQSGTFALLDRRGDLSLHRSN